MKRAAVSHSPEDRGRLERFWIAPALQGVAARVRNLSEAEIRRNRNAVILKENRLRAVYRVRLPYLDFPVLIKFFRYPTFRRTLRGIFTPYEDRELQNARVARNRGIPVADPLFLIRRRRGWRPVESLIAFRYLEGSSLHRYLSVKEALPYAERLRLMRLAGKFTALLHEKGGIHRDYHAGNLLILRDGSLALTDLFPLSFGDAIKEKERIEGLAHLIASLLPIVGQSGIDELLDGYRERSLAPLSAEDEDRILSRAIRIQRHHEASRAARCMKNSSQFYQVRLPRLRISARRILPLEEVQAVLRDFQRAYREHPEEALKNAPESVVIKLENARQIPLCVKWYRKRGRLDSLKEWARGGRALRAWKAGNGLAARGISIATPYAMAKTPEGGYLLMEIAEGIGLDRLMSRLVALKGETVRRLKRNLADSLGYFVGTLHAKGIYHADMKACNVLASTENETPSLKLIDYDYVKFFDTLPAKFVIKNLVQINTSVPKEISRSLRFRFLRAYAENFRGAPEKKRLFREVWERSRGKTIVYVTDQGDRKDRWQS